MRRRILFSYCAHIGLVCGFAPVAPAQAPPHPSPHITIRKFKRLRWSSASGHVQAEQGLQLERTDPETGKPVTFSGDNVDYDAITQQVTAQGNVSVERDEGAFKADNVRYNLETKAGSLEGAIVATDLFRMEGKRIETGSDGSFTLTDGEFTTCIHGKPDYKIHAKRLTVAPNKYVTGRNISFFLGNTKLITLPRYKRDLANTSSVSTPLPGYSVTEGAYLRIFGSPVLHPYNALNYDIRLNFSSLPYGFLDYQQELGHIGSQSLPPHNLEGLYGDPLRSYLEQLTPPRYQDYETGRYPQVRDTRISVFGIITNQQYVFNRLHTDLLVTRTPEIGIRFDNILGHQSTSPNLAPQRIGESTPAESSVKVPPLLLNIAASAGYIQELPTHAYGTRVSLNTTVATQPLVVGRRLSVRMGATDWLNAYGNGSTYALFAPEIDLDYVPTKTSLFGFGYRYMTASGLTPFQFDHQDVRNEARIRYAVGGPWGFRVIGRYDLERDKFYDAEFAVLRNFDCLQVGVTYHVLSQSVNFIINLLPATPNRARRGATPLARGEHRGASE